MSNEDKSYLDELLEASSAEPTNTGLLVNLGRMYFEPLHEPQEALLYLKKAVELEPRNTEARFWMAKTIYHYDCNYSDSRSLLEDALAINPRLPECLSLLASV